MKLQGQKVIVTGGAGFLGSHLCRRLLKEGFHVICVDNLLTGSKANIRDLFNNKRFEFSKLDVTKPLPYRLKVRAVFHLASPASPNRYSRTSYHQLPMQTMLVNTLGTLELLKFSQRQKAKFLFTSSSEVYGDPLKHPQDENYYGNVSTIGPRSVYDEAKRFGETLTAYFWRREKLDARIARIFNTYGPNMSLDDMRMAVNFIRQALADKPITIFGNGRQTRSLCYVDDTIEGLVRLMFYPNTSGQVINIGSPKEHSVLEYARLIKKLTGSKSKIVFVEPLPENDPKRRRPNILKAKKLLGWQPKISLKRGLKQLINSLK